MTSTGDTVKFQQFGGIARTGEIVQVSEDGSSVAIETLDGGVFFRHPGEVTVLISAAEQHAADVAAAQDHLMHGTEPCGCWNATHFGRCIHTV